MKKVATITLAAGLYPPDIGGPATYAAMLANELPKRGIAVSVQPFHAVRSVPKLFRHFVYTYRLWQTAKNTDLILATDAVSVGGSAWLVAKLRRVPLFVRLGGDYAWEQGVQRCGITDTLDEYTKKSPWSYGFLVRLLAGMQRFVIRRSSQVVVPSKYLKGIIATWPSVDTNKIKVIYSVLDPLPAPSAVSEKGREFTVLTAGRLVPWKGVEEVIRVVTHIPEAKLVVAGDGPQREELEELAISLEVQGRIRFAGACDKQELSNLLAEADVFVLNTAYEGLSHMLLEVMASDVPVITTNVGGNPELIEDGVSGKLVPFGDIEALKDAIMAVRNDAAIATAKARAAKERSLEFSKESSVQAFVDLLQSYDE